MKHPTLTILALLLVSGIGFSQTTKQSTGNPSSTKLETTVVHVPTVVCSSCVRNITKALKKVPGVKTTSVDLKKKTATVTYAASKVNVAKIEQAISKAGYDANSVKRDSTAYENLDSCCKIDSK